MDASKTCSKCGIEKFLFEFHKTSRTYGDKIYKYTHSKCKECRNKEKRDYHIKNRERDNKKSREYYKTHTALFRTKYRRKIDD